MVEVGRDSANTTKMWSGVREMKWNGCILMDWWMLLGEQQNLIGLLIWSGSSGSGLISYFLGFIDWLAWLLFQIPLGIRMDWDQVSFLSFHDMGGTFDMIAWMDFTDEHTYCNFRNYETTTTEMCNNSNFLSILFIFCGCWLVGLAWTGFVGIGQVAVAWEG